MTFDLPAGQVLQPGGRALMVGFDPVNNPAQLAQFLASYGLTEAPGPIWGPWLGSLSNRTERLALQRPEAPDLPGDPVGWVIVDEVLYFDRKPFDRSADGDGPSLHRRLISGHGWNPESWVALPPTPGTGIPADTPADPAWLQLH